MVNIRQIFCCFAFTALLSSCGQHREIESERIHLNSERVTTSGVKTEGAGSHPGVNEADPKSPTAQPRSILASSFSFESEELPTVDLTVDTVSNIFLSGLDTEIKRGGPAVYYKAPENTEADRALSGKLMIPVGENTLALTHVMAEKRPEWMEHCEVMVMYHLECDGAKTMGFLTDRSDMIEIPSGKGLVVNYLCPGIYQAAYNCGSERLGNGKSVRVTLSPSEVKERASGRIMDGRPDRVDIDMVQIQDSEISDSELMLQKTLLRIKEVAARVKDEKSKVSQNRSEQLQNLEKLAEETKRELVRSTDHMTSLKEQLKAIEDEGDSGMDKKRLIIAKIKHLQEKTEQLEDVSEEQREKVKSLVADQKEEEKRENKENKEEEKQHDEEKKAKKLAKALDKEKKKNKEDKEDKKDS